VLPVSSTPAQFLRSSASTSVPPPRDALLEINLLRAWGILLVTTVCTVLFTIVGRLAGVGATFAPVQFADYGVSLIFFVLLWQARQGRLPEKLRSALPFAYAIFFVLINDGYYFSVWPVIGDNVGYAFGVLTPAALLYLRPSRFVPFLLVNHVVVCALLLRQQASFESTVSAIYGATICVVVAAISSVINYRTKTAQLEKTALAARRNQELAAANLSLLEMSKRLDEMLAMTAHDLRGPLHGIASLCEMEKENPAWQEPEHAEFLEMVGQSAARMGTLVNKMVEDYAARNASLPGISLGPCDLVEIVSRAVQNARPLAQGKDIELVPLDFPSRAQAEGNADALERVFGNLLSNAIKYSPAGTRVELAIVGRDGRWQCEVRDQGPGIPLAERGTIFRKLQTGSNAPTSGEHRTGLGLYSARKLVESMQGTISYEPRPDGGSIFRVSLKVASA
jgi:signal transduction histidine kinase